MKKFFKISTVAMIVVNIFTACQNDNALVSIPSDQTTSVDSTKNAAAKNTGNAGATTTSGTINTPSFVEVNVSPKFGKPNSTMYVFKVFDASGAFPLSVKLYEKATGAITYLPMMRVGNYWMLSTTIAINGWYDWRYVYSVSKSNIGTTAYSLCNTNNTFDTYNLSSITWPFGADGSSWKVTDVIVNDFFMFWQGGTTHGTGYGWNTGSHTGYREQYSDDWNRGFGNQDLGAEVRSPLDGIIENPNGSYSTSYGQSKFVSVIQTTEDGRQYRFYVAHLDRVNGDLYEGKYVRAGVTSLGTIGQSGASSPHAHCNMRDVTNGDDRSVKFAFDAVINWFLSKN